MDESRRRGYNLIEDALPEASEIFDLIHKTLSIEDSFGKLLWCTKVYLKEHRRDTKRLKMPTPWTEDETPPFANFAVREAAGELIKAQHTYDEFLRRFDGTRIAPKADFDMLDKLRNHVEHGLAELALCYVPASAKPEPIWNLTLDLAATISDLEQTGRLMKRPKIAELERLPQCKDGTINLSEAFEIVTASAMKNYPDMSWENSVDANNSARSLREAADSAIASGRDQSEIENIVQFYSEENEIRERLAKENEKLLKRVS